MFAINSVTVNGNLTADPDVRETPGGLTICRIRIGHSSRRKQQDQWVDVPNFFDVTYFGGQADWIGRNVGKGSSVVVQGTLEWREWEKDGVKRQHVSIKGEHIVTTKGSGGAPPSGGGGGQQQRSAPPQSAPAPAAPGGFGAPPSGGGFGGPPPAPTGPSSGDDDIPF